MENKEQTKIHSPFELFYCEGLEKSGWAGLVNPILMKIIQYNKDKEENQKAVVTQIKEKFAGLRVYGYFPEHIQNMAENAENSSYHICMECGSPFNVGMTQHGWLTTLCKNCAKSQGKFDDWKLNYTSVKIDRFLLFYLKIRSKFIKLKKKIDNIKYKLFYKWRYNRKNTTSQISSLIFWKYKYIK